jgi:hypothetical protein
MKLGIELKSFMFWRKKCLICIQIPYTKVGYFSDTHERGDKFVGLIFNLRNEISVDKYDYGLIVKFIILGFGFEVTAADL